MNFMQAVQAVDARQRIPKVFKRELTFFSKHDVWHYISISDERRCINCEQFDNIDFFGDEIRTIFPDLLYRSPNVMDVNVHSTLWKKDTCRCKIVRVAEAKVQRLNIIAVVKMVTQVKGTKTVRSITKTIFENKR